MIADPFPIEPSTTVRRGGVELAVFECGNPSGVPILLVHGWPDTHLLWGGVAGLLADRYRVIAFDNRGAGASTVPGDIAAYRIEELAADVRAVAAAVAPGQRVHMLGHDWGAVLGWELAAALDAESVLASYTSVSGPNLDFLGAYLRGPVSWERLRNTITQGVASAYTFAFQVPGLPNPALNALARRWPDFLAFFDGLDPALVRTAPTLRDDMINGLALYRANIRPRMRRPRPRPIEVPVQLIVSTGDRAVRPLVYAEADRWVRDLTRREIAARHWSPFSHAADLARFTAEFADRVDAGRGPGAR
ncbi:alpha/beta fold hydrolase [Nocardia donostiensis]|uniref:Alpha/beta hydrolase n=1 Tax=Nocardia donostiensis TaxID=1538463 RepID=A0A1V2THS9_9NOCA|nr:alpha/beta fold hydrolase [Nocardia donostiensis]ONM49079.1 alpha/beta hydrolase [Nocardia donostiensis]OQS14097.1 alpha/beta hydrolase [Nocardia donostiensis]OQS19742.1 alpha/beta hydrolase [Nocardia donostiensis]